MQNLKKKKKKKSVNLTTFYNKKFIATFWLMSIWCSGDKTKSESAKNRSCEGPLIF